jgi:hypothetical protein
MITTAQARPLTTTQQHDLFEKFGLALDNFSLAWRVADLLLEYAVQELPPPRATIQLVGEGREVRIPAQNCGLFTTPVIYTAVLDCRRMLEFFGLTYESKTQTFKPITKRRADDVGIEHLGLELVSPSRLFEVIDVVTTAPLEQSLVSVHRWSNKELAHFTSAKPSVDLQAIRDVSKAMIEACLQLIFDALGQARPRIQPVEAK